MKIRKNLSNKWSMFLINIDDVKFNCNFMFKILNLFKFNEILIIINYIEKDNALFNILLENKINYTTNIVDDSNVDCCICLSKYNIDILSSFNLNNYDFLIMDIKNIGFFDDIFIKLKKIHYSKFLTMGLSSFSIGFFSSDKAIEILAKSEFYNQDFLVKEINCFSYDCEFY